LIIGAKYRKRFFIWRRVSGLLIKNEKADRDLEK
jgi:hypothetical protein